MLQTLNENITINAEKLSPMEKIFMSASREYINLWFGQNYLIQNYEGVTFSIPGGRYTPDFNYFLEDGTLLMVEVKGNQNQHGYEAAMVRIRIAAALNPYALFIVALYSRKKKIFEHFVVNADYHFLMEVMKNAENKKI